MFELTQESSCSLANSTQVLANRHVPACTMPPQKRRFTWLTTPCLVLVSLVALAWLVSQAPPTKVLADTLVVLLDSLELPETKGEFSDSDTEDTFAYVAHSVIPVPFAHAHSWRGNSSYLVSFPEMPLLLGTPPPESVA
jgi:hypothetical protein